MKKTTTILLFLNIVMTAWNCTASVIQTENALPIVACLNAFAAGIMFETLGRVLREEKIKKIYEEASKNFLEEMKEKEEEINNAISKSK